MDSNLVVEQAALRLRQAAASGLPCAPVRDLLGETDVALAYRVQAHNTEYQLRKGEQIEGVKIGLTSEAVQKQLGVDQPDFGLLWQHTRVEANGAISLSEVMQGKAEVEIAFVMQDALDAADLSLEELTDAVAGACLSIEIVGSRIMNWDIRITDTVADNASASHWMISDLVVPIDQIDLLGCKMNFWNRDELVSEGIGRNCLDSPLIALHWLANTMYEMGQPIRKGDIVLSGALGAMVNLNAGDRFTAEIEGLGELTLRIHE
ncbi:MAG: fumarylacetoacetate hydrolase family protein [Bacteroidota bacterium]